MYILSRLDYDSDSNMYFVIHVAITESRKVLEAHINNVSAEKYKADLYDTDISTYMPESEISGKPFSRAGDITHYYKIEPITLLA